MIYAQYIVLALCALVVVIYLLEAALFKSFVLIHAKHAVLTVIGWVMDFVGLFAVTIALGFRDPEGRLPAWAWPWNNDREPCGDTERQAEILAASGFRVLFLRWHWLAIRNPGNNFGHLVGFTQDPRTAYAYDGEPDIGDQSKPGTLIVRAWLDSGVRAFCYYRVSKKYWLFGWRCLRVFIGWKIHDMMLDGKKAQLVFVVNPLMSYEGAL